MQFISPTQAPWLSAASEGLQNPKKFMWVPFLRSFPGNEAHKPFCGGPIALEGIALPLAPMFFRYRRVSRYTPQLCPIASEGGGGVARGVAAQAALWGCRAIWGHRWDSIAYRGLMGHSRFWKMVALWLKLRYFRNPCDRDAPTGNFKNFKFFKNSLKILNVYF